MSETVIRSAANAKVKMLRKLREKKALRLANKLIYVEGQREISAALTMNQRALDLFLPEGKAFTGDASKFDHVWTLSQGVFDKVALRSEGVALFERRASSLMQKPPIEGGLYLICDGLEKPGNYGALLRTADAIGIDGVIAGGENFDWYSPNIIRASLGTVFGHSVASATAEEIFVWSQSTETPAKVVIADNTLDRSSPWTEANYKGTVFIVLGAEDTGVSAFWKSHATQAVYLPQNGLADSLNVSTAGAVILFEAWKQRNQS